MLHPCEDYYYSGEPQKKACHVAPGSTITNAIDQLDYPNRKRRNKMKAALIAIVVALTAIITTSTFTWRQRIITAIVAAAIALSVCLFVPGCMSTTEIEGKTYSWRLDILAPIGATVPDPNPPRVRTQPAQGPDPNSPVSGPNTPKVRTLTSQPAEAIHGATKTI
jgi:hypothetical protein